MKLNEIMIIREDGLKIFQVDDATLTKLARIRGNVYADDPRLRTMSELPTMLREPQQTPVPVYSQAAIEATEKAVALYKLMQESKVTISPRVIEPEPKPMTFDEQLAHDWRHSPSLRREFTSFGSYQAYMRAAESGRCKDYGV